MKVAAIVDIAKKTLHEFSEHKVVQLSGALAYNAIFALAPFLLVVVGVAGLVLGADTVRHQVENQLSTMIGPQAASVIQSMMDARHRGESIVATVVGTVVLLFAAAGLFGQLKNALNTIWEVKAKPGRGIKGMLRDRFLSLAMVFGICFLLLVSMILSTILASSSEALGRALSLPEWIGFVVDLVFSFGVLTVLFAAMFKFLPDVKIPWRNVWGGAVATAVLFSIGKWGLALYLGRASTASAYGAAGSFVVIIMWIYYASVIVFLGAELTQVVTRQVAGVKVQPTANAMLAEPAATPQLVLVQPEPRGRQTEPATTSVAGTSFIVKALSAFAIARWLVGVVREWRGRNA